jgi:hypothetical protein
MFANIYWMYIIISFIVVEYGLDLLAKRVVVSTTLQELCSGGNKISILVLVLAILVRSLVIPLGPSELMLRAFECLTESHDRLISYSPYLPLKIIRRD